MDDSEQKGRAKAARHRERPEGGAEPPRQKRVNTASSSGDPSASEAAMKVALRLLSLRGRSRHELSLALERRHVSEPVRDEVLGHLSALGYLDDGRFALERARSLLLRGRFGKTAVIERLCAHGLSSAAAAEATEKMSMELGIDPLTEARRLLDRRGLLDRRLTRKESARAARLLEARGFEQEVIHRLIPSVSLESEDLDG